MFCVWYQSSLMCKKWVINLKVGLNLYCAVIELNKVIRLRQLNKLRSEVVYVQYLYPEPNRMHPKLPHKQHLHIIQLGTGCLLIFTTLERISSHRQDCDRIWKQQTSFNASSQELNKSSLIENNRRVINRQKNNTIYSHR